MPSPIIILISGKRFSGKDTFAKILQQLLIQKGKHVTTMSTSYELKRRFCQIYNLDFEKFIQDREYKEQHRSNLADFVSEQKIEENLNHFSEKIKKISQNYDFIIVSDIRSKFDLDNLKKTFYSISVRLLINQKFKELRGFRPSDYDQSEFETSLDNDKFDFEIDNNGDLEQLKQAASLFINNIHSQ